MLDRLGLEGVDPRISWRKETEGGVRIFEAGSIASGYSPTFKLWWRSLYLLDVPVFKFWLVQIFNIMLLATLLIVAPCVDIWNQHEEQSCFTDSNWDHMALFPGDIVNVATNTRRLVGRAKGLTQTGSRTSGAGPYDTGSGNVSSAELPSIPVSQGVAAQVRTQLPRPL